MIKNKKTLAVMIDCPVALRGCGEAEMLTATTPRQ